MLLINNIKSVLKNGSLMHSVILPFLNSRRIYDLDREL